MVSQAGGNVHVFGLRGNFDDAQTGVKNVFQDQAFGAELAARGMRLSSANSINIGRLVPQVAYYVSAWARLVGGGEIEANTPINVCVPTGNFGNILAAFYARAVGVPIAKLICASNENNVLTDFLQTGVYDARREFKLTSSPSMDILVSSNLERLLWALTGGDAGAVRALMQSLDRDGHYDIGALMRPAEREVFETVFTGGFADMTKAHGALADLWRTDGYLIDTHTAVAYAVWRDYARESGDETKTIIASTASPYKFAGNVSRAIGLPPAADEFAAVEALHQATRVPIPECLQSLESLPILHDQVVGKEGIATAVAAALGDKPLL